MIKEAIELIGKLAVQAGGVEVPKVTTAMDDDLVRRVTIIRPRPGAGEAAFENMACGPSVGYTAASLTDFVTLVQTALKWERVVAHERPVMVSETEAIWQFDQQFNLTVKTSWKKTRAWENVHTAWLTPAEALYRTRRVLGCDAATVQMFRQLRLKASSEQTAEYAAGQQKETLGKSVAREAAGLTEAILTGPIVPYTFDAVVPQTPVVIELDVRVDYGEGKVGFVPDPEVIEQCERHAQQAVLGFLREQLPGLVVARGELVLVPG